MSCSRNCKMCRCCRYVRKHIKNFIIRTLCLLNACSLLFLMCLVDSTLSWWCPAVMGLNAAFLLFAAYANGFFVNPKSQKEAVKDGTRRLRKAS